MALLTIYTNISKPVGTPYTDVNAAGKEQYDQSTITYDDSTIFYDGTNPNLYTSVAKPISTSYINIAKPT